MLYILFGFYVLRALWGSAEIQRGLEIASRYRWMMLGVTLFLLARLGGNILTGRFDLGSLAGLVNEAAISLLIVVLVVTYVTTKEHILTVLALVSITLLINQLVAVFEFSAGRSLFPANLEIQYATNDATKLAEGSIRAGYFRSKGFFDNPLKLAGFLCLTIPVSIALARTSRFLVVRVLATATVVLAIPTAIFTGSRTAIAVTLMIFVWYAYAHVSRRFGPNGRLLVPPGGAPRPSDRRFAWRNRRSAPEARPRPP